MRQPKTFLLLGTVLGILMLSVAYAAIQNITLEINGIATATPDQSNFDVRITSLDANNWFTYGDTTQITKSISNDGLSATIIATNLSEIGDGFSCCPTIKNFSTDLKAYISYTINVTGDTEYFNIYDTDRSDNLEIAPGDEGYPIEFSVELKKLPIEKEVSITFTIDIIASPVQPGSSGGGIS